MTVIASPRRTCTESGLRHRDCYCEPCVSLQERAALLHTTIANRNCPYGTPEDCERYFAELDAQLARLERQL